MQQPEVNAANQALERAVREDDEDGVLAAISSGADVTMLLPPTDKKYPCASFLILACEKGNARIMRHLLDAGHHVDCRGKFPYTPLQCAVHLGYNDCVSTLLAARPDLEATDGNSNTALHLAARRSNIFCVNTLIEAGANVDARDDMMRTPLLVSVLANSTEVMRLLLAAGCDYTAVNNAAFTAMHIAALSGNEAAIQELYRAGLDPETQDATGLLPEDVAEAWGRHNTAWLLRKLPKLKPSVQRTPVRDMTTRSWNEYESEGQKTMLWVQEKDIFLLEASLPKNRDGHYQDTDGLTPLHLAAKLGLTDVVHSLINSCQVLPGVVTYNGETPADLARQAGHEALAAILVEEAAPQKQPPQADEGAATLYNNLLMVISTGDDMVAARQLLRSGAPLEPTGDFYTSALVLAVTCNRPRIVSLLVAAGAPLTTCSAGLSLLQLAWRSHDVTIRVRILITRHFLNTLEVEKRRIRPEDEALREGVEILVNSIRGATPWQASWPPQPLRQLSSLMVAAATNNCPLIASFLKLAGAKSFLQDDLGSTPLHAAIDAQHWHFAELMIKHMGGCLYIPDSSGRLPLDMLPVTHRIRIEKDLYHHERRQLEDFWENVKDKEEKDELQAVIDVYKSLFKRYLANTTLAGTRLPSVSSTLQLASHSYSLLVSSRRGLLQLTYLLVTVGGLHVDAVIDPTHDSTALHQAASHGNSGSLALLLSLGACPLKQDRYGHTPAHFAAMFGHDTSYNQLKVYMSEQQPVSVAGTTPDDLISSFKKYLIRYKKTVRDLDTMVFNYPSEGIKKILNSVNIRDISKELNKISIDFTDGEAQQVKEAMTNEVHIIMDKVSAVDRVYEGELTIVGSSSDGTRLYAPDEYDMSVVLSNITGISIEIVEQNPQQAALSGHRLRVLVKSEHPSLQGNVLISKFYDLVSSCLKTHVITNSRLSLVPPGVTRTQVGVSLTFAWQGKEYPLLLISIDLVPVLAVPWPAEVSRPPLTPANITQVYLSNTADGEWRCSFAGAEAEVLSELTAQERRVYLACKALLSYLKAEPWMPREVKANYIWWDSRKWKIMIPAGFAMKNSYLIELQNKREKKLDWTDKDLIEMIIIIMKNLCQEFHDPSTNTDSLVPSKIYAYFGGEFEKPKIGEGAPDIIKALKEIQE
nr:ankyrin-3-like isoform X1 [Procambarus clarkii]